MPKPNEITIDPNAYYAIKIGRVAQDGPMRFLPRNQYPIVKGDVVKRLGDAVADVVITSIQ